MRLFLCLLSALPFCVQAHATEIYFDDLPGSVCNPLDIASCGPNVTNQYAALGVTFNNPTAAGADIVDTNLTSLIPDASAPNVLFVYQGGLLSQPAFAPFQILFSAPVTSVGFDFGSSTDAYLEMDVYGAGNTLLETQDFVGSSASIGLAGFAQIQESTPITEVDLSYHPNSDTSRTLNFSIDNLEFSQVPEPSSLAMMAIASLAGIALKRRRKRSFVTKG
jgi:hypothetical protein